MKTPKTPANQPLHKNSALFLQLGLLLALIFAFVALEFTTIKTVTSLNEKIPTDNQKFIADVGTINIERPEVPKTEIIRQDIPIPNEPVTPNNPLIDKPEWNNTLNPPVDNPSEGIGIIEVVTPEDVNENVEFIKIEQVPVFPGCEGLDNEASKKCFNKKISEFIVKRFDINIANELQLNGKQIIVSRFTIDKTGNITDIKIRAPHKKLEKEAQRLIEGLPTMTPGKQRLRPVNVIYTLPIRFEVH